MKFQENCHPVLTGAPQHADEGGDRPSHGVGLLDHDATSAVTLSPTMVERLFVSALHKTHTKVQFLPLKSKF